MPPAANTHTRTPIPAQAPARAVRTASHGRMALVNGLIVLTTLLAIMGLPAGFANRLLFNPSKWQDTSTELLQNSAIRSATSNYIVDQLDANLNIAGLIKSGLPPRLDPLAAPAAGALRSEAVKAVDLALSRPRVQSLWA